nr:immunoglobulin light chain junction region [Macaca mulatta]
CQHTYGFPLTF